MTARELAEALKGRKVGLKWMAHCVAHDDRNPSLSISESHDGKILVHCFAGCSSEQAIIPELRARGLWPDQSGDWREWRHGVRYPAEWGAITTEYAYTDETGAALYSVFRLSPKSFRQGYTDSGKWHWKKHTQQVLYRLPEVIVAPLVLVTEGESDVEAVRKNGFIGTTNAGGAKAPWLPQYTAALAGRDVVILPDADGPGWNRAVTIARALWQSATVRVLELPGVKDVREWFEEGHTATELRAHLESSDVV